VSKGLNEVPKYKYAIKQVALYD